MRPLLKLYHYDHCPYCVKARMILGFKNVPFEIEALANDDERTPISLTGKKMVPIILKKDGEPLNESLDIIDYVDGMEEYGPRMVKPSKNDLGLNRWLKEARNYHYYLAMPRWIRMGLPEFSTHDSVQYFLKKKEDFMGSFEEKIEQTPKLIKMAHEHLAELEENMPEEGYIWGDLSLDDFHLFATLRVLTAVKDVNFPPKVKAYCQRVSEASKVFLHWEIAV